ncbi:MAG: DNA polymerase IV [Pseudolabrys sp.]|nr:DNA polymerase IV [Pseudolabrys sp.]MDP2294795.1 DNA polymerase IV [Pseudolabrys sp.]
MSAFCRDCLTDAPETAKRCPACGSPRLVRHPELGTLTISHIDCDAFYATIEKRDDPALTDRPVIVGGGKRGVVATCCYVARTYGVRSAMPMFKALELCPQAAVVKPNMSKYVEVGRAVRSRMLALTPQVEPLSIDEAFLDLTGTERLHGMTAAKVLARFAIEVERDLGITVSIGLSANKFLAKIASDLDKPRGFAVLGQLEAAAFLSTRPVGFIYGVGAVSAARLAADGYRLIADLQRADQNDLMRRYGEEGLRLWHLARGLDTRRVDPVRDTKSVSAETTFNENISGLRPLEQHLWDLTERVSARLKKAQLAGSTVTLKLKTSDFKLRTRSRSLGSATQLATRIFADGRDMLRNEVGATRFRLIGIGVSHLVDATGDDLSDLIDRRGAQAEHAIDKLRSKFGKGAVVKGLALDED